MKVKVYPSHTGGLIDAPPSKSSMQRAVAAALLARGMTTIENPSYADDSLSALKMAECLGARVSKDPHRVTIMGGFSPVSTTLNPGESGLGVRMFSPIAALHDREIILSGKGSLMSRPMDIIANSLNELGATVTTTGGLLPVRVKGPLTGGECTVDGSLSSQFLTGLLFALPLARNDSLIKVTELKSRPYIDLTLKVLNHFGVEIENHDYREFRIRGRQRYIPCDYRVEPDWSGLAFHAVLGATGDAVTIKGTEEEPVQADSAIMAFLERAGATVINEKGSLSVKAESVEGFRADLTDCPDLAPPLVALAVSCIGRTELTGTARLKVKESDRAETLHKEFAALGATIKVLSDSIMIEGGTKLRGGIVNSHGDHRIAMALAIAAAKAEGPVIIEGAEAVSKSYPGFFDDIAKLGLKNEIVK